MLSISLFIAIVAKKRSRNDLAVHFVTNNMELVKYSNKHLNYTHPYSNNTLKSEYNIAEQIYLTHLTCKITSIFPKCTDIKIVEQVGN